MATRTPCIGLVVPPAHGQVPQDGPMLYGDRYRFIARGLGIGGVSPEGFAPVVDGIVERAVELRKAGAEVVSMMGTSISFYRGPEFTESLRRAMEEATGVPCTTMSHAIVRALQQLGVKRVAVATSYIDELNDKLQAYLTHAGFTVTAIEGMSITGVKEVGEVSTEQLVALAKKVYAQDPSAEGIFISCGGLLTLDAIRRLEDEVGVPATASSPAGFWDVVRLAGGDASSAGFGKLFA
ncbi:arylmalonate decarboxylase [Ramlibacter sp. USB13]|uniref:Arylmalonate decarboxylase n=1 Tax=Ramlibacter cellulosilyticus TaxID=2764187 RepID=A0A923MV08_9BURK|nr:aspartate/glutamate racemase family protein [Ramlibacter cellulosilyticus]MBC5784252.1 arylmalonate decarboxylase [Ramlibacter cellulosilyticus]